MDQTKAKKTGKARIPDHLRRRALVSCDRCKKRRIRCIRSTGADGQESCQSCLEVGVSCESTLPRKTRIYGSVETLSLRYRVLDALIKGLYPYKDTNNIDTLYAIADAHDITLPAFNDQSVTDEVFSQPQKHGETSPEHSGPSDRSPSITSKESDAATTASSKIHEEKLVPLPQGPSHYIGPSSSFGFVLTVRNMVAEFNAALKTVQPDDERAKISSDFAGSNWSKALEPINKEESDESSEEHTDRETTSSMPTVAAQNRGFYQPPLFTVPTGSGTVGNKSRKTLLLSLLPTKEVSDVFVEAYFDKVHPNYLLFHRETFQLRYDSMWINPGVLLRDVEPGWVSVVFMMLVFGAQVLEDRDKGKSVQIQRHYLDLVQGRMHQLISATTLINVQALLLLQLYQHNCTERNSAFMLLGCASRMAMALGMHRDGTSGGFDEMEREVRKRVWWTAYTFEQNQCAILGRPCAIDDTEVNVSFPNELMLDGGHSVPPGYIEYSVRLIKLMSEIRRKIYDSPISPTSPGDHPKIGVAIQFLLDLDSWHHSLPAHLRLEFLSHPPKHRRAVMLLHILFHHTQALVSRPFVLRKVGVQLARKLGKHVRSQDLDKEEANLSHACGTFSRKCVNLLHQLILSGMFDGVAWLDAYYIYHSVFILALDFLARPWDDKETIEDQSRKKAVRDVMNALHDVKLCPTFTVLTQVSLQLAKIVGIFDTAPATNHEQSIKSEQVRQYMVQHQAQASQVPYQYEPQVQIPQQPVAVENVVNSWFQKEPVDLPWDMRDFFGVDGYVGPSDSNAFPQLPMTLGNSYSSHLPGVSEEDDLATPLPPNIGYTQWGAIDTPFAPNRGDPSGNLYKGGN